MNRYGTGPDLVTWPRPVIPSANGANVDTVDASGAEWGIERRQSWKRIAPLARQYEYRSIAMLNVWRDRVVEFSVGFFLLGALGLAIWTFFIHQ